MNPNNQQDNNNNHALTPNKEEKSENKSSSSAFEIGNFFRKFLKRNDTSPSQPIVVAPQIPNEEILEPSYSHKPSQSKCVDTIEFNDPLILKIFASQDQKNLRQFCGFHKITYRLRRDRKPAAIEVYSDQQNTSDDTLQKFRGALTTVSDKIRSELEQKHVNCNEDEYKHIMEQLEDSIDILDSCEITLIDSDGNKKEQSQIKGAVDRLHNPQLLKSYTVNRRFTIKLKRIEKPAAFGFSTLDVLLINLESDSIFKDSFGRELVENNKQIKDLIQNNRDRIGKEALITNQKFTCNISNKEINLVLQSSRSESDCIDNLKSLLVKVKNQQLPKQGFLNIGISMHQNCGKNYVSALLKVLSEIKEDDESHLAFPTEIHLFVSREQEKQVTSYINEVISTKNINATKQKKGGKWYKGFQFKGNQIGGGAYRNDFSGVSIKTLSPFNDNLSTMIERAYLKDKYIFYIPTPQYAKEKNTQGKNTMEAEEGDLVSVEEVLVDFEKMTETFLSSKIERLISQDEQANKWKYIDVINQDFVDFESDLCRVFRSCAEVGIKSFTYQRNLLDFSLHSRIMKVDLNKSKMTDLSSGDVYAVKREQNEKYNYIVNEVNPDSKVEFINIQEVKAVAGSDKKQNSDQKKSNKPKQPQIRIRGLNGSVTIIDEIISKMRKDLWSTHQIQLEKRLLKRSVEHLADVARKHNVEITYREKFYELELKGFSDTISKIKDTFNEEVKSQLGDQISLPEDWDDQYEEVELFQCDLDTEYSEHIIGLIENSLPRSVAKVTKIYRVQNRKLWKRFDDQKAIVEAEKDEAKMRWLFHGTQEVAPSVLYKDGFDFRVHEGGQFGTGIYFSESAQKAYRSGYKKGTRKIQIICAKVLTGKSYPTAPDRSIEEPPYIPRSRSVRFDSVRSDRGRGNNDFVIYNSNQAYPYYLVTLLVKDERKYKPVPKYPQYRVYSRYNNRMYQDDEDEEEEDGDYCTSDEDDEDDEDDDDEDDSFIDDDY